MMKQFPTLQICHHNFGKNLVIRFFDNGPLIGNSPCKEKHPCRSFLYRFNITLRTDGAGRSTARGYFQIGIFNLLHSS